MSRTQQLMEFAIAHRKINGNSFWISLKKKDPTQGVESTLFQCNICLFAVVSNHQPRRESYCNFNHIVLNYAPKGPVNFFQDETPHTTKYPRCWEGIASVVLLSSIGDSLAKTISNEP